MEKKNIKKDEKKEIKWAQECLNNEQQNKINTDPQGSWTGVPTDDPYEKPIQDADDL